MKSDLSEVLKMQIIPIIEKSGDGLAAAVDFLCEQSPILVREILVWHGVRSAIPFVCGLLVVLVVLLTRKKGVAWAETAIEPKATHKDRCPYSRRCKDMQDGLFLAWAWCLAGRIVAVIVGLVLMARSLTWLKVLFAPRLFLLEYIREVVS